MTSPFPQPPSTCDPTKIPKSRIPSLPLLFVVAVQLFGVIPFLHASQEPPAPPPSTATTPRRGGTFRMALPEDARSYDPAFGFTIGTIPLQRVLFETLLDLDQQNQVIPAAAEKWSLSDDQRTYTLALRKNMRFFDGTPVTAQDFIYSLERILNPKTASMGSSYYTAIRGAHEFRDGSSSHVAGLKALSPHTLQIELSEPQFTFQYVLCMVFTAPLQQKRIEANPQAFTQRPIGSGPYYLKEAKRGSHYTLERNPHYTQTNTAFLDRIEIMIGGDRSLHAMMFDRGELDFVPDLRVTDSLRYSRSPTQRALLQFIPMASTDYIFLNNEIPPLDNPQVRKALHHAVNKERFLKLSNPAFKIAYGILPPTMPGYAPDPTLYEYNPEKAKQLLADAGFPNGFRTQLWFSDSVPHWKNIVTGVAEDWKRVGVHADMVQVSSAAVDEAYATRKKVPAGYYGWVQDYPDPSNFLDVLLNGENIRDAGCLNVAFYNQPPVNQTLNKAMTVTRLTERISSYSTIEKQIMADSPWIPTVHTVYPTVVQPWIRGFQAHPVWLYRFETLWIDPQIRSRSTYAP